MAHGRAGPQISVTVRLLLLCLSMPSGLTASRRPDCGLRVPPAARSLAGELVPVQARTAEKATRAANIASDLRLTSSAIPTWLLDLATWQIKKMGIQSDSEKQIYNYHKRGHTKVYTMV